VPVADPLGAASHGDAFDVVTVAVARRLQPPPVAGHARNFLRVEGQIGARVRRGGCARVGGRHRLRGVRLVGRCQRGGSRLLDRNRLLGGRFLGGGGGGRVALHGVQGFLNRGVPRAAARSGAVV